MSEKDQESFHQIMDKITSKLTGNPDEDISYLNQQSKKYKDHKYGTEIVRACGRLVFDLLPEDKKQEITRLVNNRDTGIQSTLDEVKFNISKKDYTKAFEIIEALVKQVENDNLFADDEVSEYRVFSELFEEILYLFLAKPQKDVRHANVPYPNIYYLYGSLLIELGRYTDAKASLQKGLRWNPTSFTITAEYIEIFKITENYENFFQQTLEAFNTQQAIHPPPL